MDSGGCKKSKNAGGVSFKMLGLVFGSAVAGCVLSVLFLRAVAGGVESVSVVGLIGFSFMLVLATVAITLSVVAILLTRRVESLLMHHGKIVQPSVESCWTEPAQPAHAGEFPVRTEPSGGTVEKADKKYGDFKNIVLLGVSNYPGVSARQVGEGPCRTAGDGRVDGSFQINREQVAVCVFSIQDTLAGRFLGKQGEKFSSFLKSLSNELKNGTFSRVFMVFDGVLNNANSYAKALNEFSSRIDASAFARFELFEGSPEIVIPELTERVSQLMATDAGEAH